MRLCKNQLLFRACVAFKCNFIICEEYEETHKLQKCFSQFFHKVTEILQQTIPQITLISLFIPQCNNSAGDKFKDDVTEKEAWLGAVTPTHAINLHRDKSSSLRAELLAAERRHERKRKCCGHPCHQNCLLMPKSPLKVFPGISGGQIPEGWQESESFPHWQRRKKDSVNFKTPFIVTMLTLCGEETKGVKKRRSAVAVQPSSERYRPVDVRTPSYSNTMSDCAVQRQ